MVSHYEWRDMLIADRVNYYNRTRLSLEMFAKKIGIPPQVLLREMEDFGYRYDPARHLLFFNPPVREAPLCFNRKRGR